MTQINQDIHPKSDPYNLEILNDKLKNLGYEPHYFLEIENTMGVISEFAQNNTKNSVIALTDHQTRGIGREKRTWYDTPGCSIMLSALFQIKDANIAIFADLIALEICHVLRTITDQKSIKIQYPNDLVYKDKKLGGILVKNIYDDNLKYLGTTIGIGINVHYTEVELLKFSTDYPATSLDAVTDSYVKRQDILVDLLSNLRYLSTEVDIIAINPHARAPFEKQWQQSSSLLGRQIVLLKHNQPLQEGKVVDTEIGKGIKIQTSKGRIWFSLFESDMKARILS